MDFHTLHQHEPVSLPQPPAAAVVYRKTVITFDDTEERLFTECSKALTEAAAEGVLLDAATVLADLRLRK